MIHLLVENAAKKVYRFVFFPLGNQHLNAAVNLLGSAVQIADLQEPSSHFEQVVMSILVQLNQA